MQETKEAISASESSNWDWDRLTPEVVRDEIRRHDFRRWQLLETPRLVETLGQIVVSCGLGAEPSAKDLPSDEEVGHALKAAVEILLGRAEGEDLWGFLQGVSDDDDNVSDDDNADGLSFDAHPTNEDELSTLLDRITKMIVVYRVGRIDCGVLDEDDRLDVHLVCWKPRVGEKLTVVT